MATRYVISAVIQEAMMEGSPRAWRPRSGVKVFFPFWVYATQWVLDSMKLRRHSYVGAGV